jgi:hypothetical protein
LAALCAISAATGVLLLLVFRYTSNQTGIAAAKDRIKAHVLEIRLFKDDPLLVVQAQKAILLTTLGYLKLTLVPLAVMLIPIVYLALHLDSRFGYHPLRQGDATILGVTLADGTPWNEATIELAVPDGLTVETPPLRIPAKREVDWRVRAVREGSFLVTIKVNDRVFQKELSVGDGLARVTSERRRGASIERLWSPGEGPLPPDSPVEAITLRYRPRTFELFGWETHWLVLFFLGSLVAGYALQGVFRVKL